MLYIIQIKIYKYPIKIDVSLYHNAAKLTWAVKYTH